MKSNVITTPQPNSGCAVPLGGHSENDIAVVEEDLGDQSGLNKIQNGGMCKHCLEIQTRKEVGSTGVCRQCKNPIEFKADPPEKEIVTVNEDGERCPGKNGNCGELLHGQLLQGNECPNCGAIVRFIRKRPN